MPLSINHPEAAELAAQLAARTGESVDDAVVKALRERLERTPKPPDQRASYEELMELARRCVALPDLDPRSPDDSTKNTTI